MDTTSSRATPNQLHEQLFTPLSWLDLLDETHLSCNRLCPTLTPNTPLHHTLAQLLASFAPLEQSLAWHPLLDCQRHTKLLHALHRRQHRIATLIAALRPQLEQLLRDTPASAAPQETLWDEVDALAPALQEQLIRYLALLEQAFRHQKPRSRQHAQAPTAALMPRQQATLH